MERKVPENLLYCLGWPLGEISFIRVKPMTECKGFTNVILLRCNLVQKRPGNEFVLHLRISKGDIVILT